MGNKARLVSFSTSSGFVVLYMIDMIYLTELGANLAGEDRGDGEQGTSGIPSTSSGKSGSVVYRKSVTKEIRNQIDSVEEDNLV